MSKMDLSQFIVRVGFPTAIIVCRDYLEDSYFDRLSFDQWAELVRSSNTDEVIKTKSLTRMTAMAKIFSQWYVVYSLTPPGYSSRTEILAKMADEAEELSEWLILAQQVNSDSDLWSRVVKAVMARRLNGSFETWRNICHGNVNSELYEIAIRVMLEMPKSLDQWCQVYHLCRQDSLDQIHALTTISQFTAEFGEWEKLFFSSSGDSPLREIARQQLANRILIPGGKTLAE